MITKFAFVYVLLYVSIGPKEATETHGITTAINRMFALSHNIPNFKSGRKDLMHQDNLPYESVNVTLCVGAPDACVQSLVR